jgi:hypothetical protein
VLLWKIEATIPAVLAAKIQPSVMDVGQPSGAIKHGEMQFGAGMLLLTGMGGPWTVSILPPTATCSEVLTEVPLWHHPVVLGHCAVEVPLVQLFTTPTTSRSAVASNTAESVPSTADIRMYGVLWYLHINFTAQKRTWIVSLFVCISFHEIN